jgi:outer membrane protein TolC
MNLPVYDGNPANLATATQFAYIPSIPINMMDYINTAAVTVTQPVFTGGRIINGNKLAKVGYEINREKQTLTITDVLVKTEELYWTVITLREKIKTLDSYRKLLDTLHRDVTGAYKAGLVQRTDLLKVELKQNEVEINTLKLHNGINLSQRALCQHIGIAYDSTLMLAGPAAELELPQKYYVKPDIAVTSRSEYKMLSSVIVAEKLQKRMVIGENLPQVAIGGVGLYMDIMNSSSTNALAFATVSIPITDWWGGMHKIKQSKAKVESARNKLSETSELLSLQIEQANNELNENYFQVSITQKSIEQAIENLKVTTDYYRAGISTMSDLLEAQSAYQSTLDNLTESQCNYRIKKAKYLQAINNYK